MFIGIFSIVVVASLIFLNAHDDEWNKNQRPDYLTDFYKKVDSAERESHRINHDNFLFDRTESEADLGKKRSRVADCLSGSYVSDEKNAKGLRCRKSFVRYFGIAHFDQENIRAIDSYMKSLGWQEATLKTDYPLIENGILNDTKRGYGFQYTNAQGIQASTYFARKNSSWPMCKTTIICAVSNDKDKDYQGYIEVTVFYRQYY